MPHALALSSGTAALHLALVVLGIGAGDEVACSSLTFSASANPIRYVGATPVFVDADRGDVDDRSRRCSSARSPSARRSRPSSPSTSTGSAATTTRSARSAPRTASPLVQDAAESLGATYRDAPAGGQGDLAVFSFNGNKVITTSGGGMLVSRNDGVDRARAQALDAGARARAALRAHRDRLQLPALSNLLAAVGRAQLEVLPGAGRGAAADQRPLPRAAARRRVHARGARYGRATAGSPASSSTSPSGVRLALEAEDIEARPLWKPMHLQPVLRGTRRSTAATSRRACSSAASACRAGSALADDDQRRVAEIAADATRGLARRHVRRSTAPSARSCR